MKNGWYNWPSWWGNPGVNVQVSAMSLRLIHFVIFLSCFADEAGEFCDASILKCSFPNGARSASAACLIHKKD